MPSLLPIAVFAFTMSFLPGPVNIITLASGVQNGVRKTLGFVAGASIGFSALLLLLGLGLGAVPVQGHWIEGLLVWAGAGLIVYIALPLFRADALQVQSVRKVPGFLQGAMLQWLNPKAWGAILAALSLFNLRPQSLDVILVTVIWGCLCFVGVGLWAVFGAQLQHVIRRPSHMRWLCRAMGCLLLVLVAGFLGEWLMM